MYSRVGLNRKLSVCELAGETQLGYGAERGPHPALPSGQWETHGVGQTHRFSLALP